MATSTTVTMRIYLSLKANPSTVYYISGSGLSVQEVNELRALVAQRQDVDRAWVTLTLSGIDP